MKLLNILYWKLKRKFGVVQNASCIPVGVYCYVADKEKNENKSKGDYTFYTKPCKYYKTLKFGYNGCSYLGIITNDCVFGDQCKMCEENY